jgi:hypothetical protein
MKTMRRAFVALLACSLSLPAVAQPAANPGIDPARL